MSNTPCRAAWREVVRRKKRSCTTIAGYLLIVSFVVLLTNLLLTARAAKQVFLENLGTHFLVFFPKPQTGSASQELDRRLLDPAAEGFFADPTMTRLFPLARVDEIRAISGVKAASAFLLFRFRDPASGEIFCLGGFDPANPAAVNGTSLQKRDVIRGEFLTPSDRGAALLEEGFAVYRGLEVGSSLTVGGVPFTVKGIVRPGIRPAKADIYVRFEEAEKAIDRRLTAPLAGEANVVLVEGASASTYAQALETVRKAYPDCLIDTYDCFNPASRTSGIDESAILAALAVLTLVLLLFAGKSQLAAVVEKRHEIGILCAIGWSEGRVLRQLLAETLIQSLTGGVLGCLLGIGLTFLLSNWLYAGFAVRIEAASVLAGLLLAVCGGSVAAVAVMRAIVAAPPAANLGRT